MEKTYIVNNNNKNYLELTVAQIMSSLLQNPDLNLRKYGKSLGHSDMTYIKSLMIIQWRCQVDSRD